MHHIQQVVANAKLFEFPVPKKQFNRLLVIKLLSNVKLKYKRKPTTKMATILFDSSKNELFKLTDNYKTVNRKLKANYKTET